VSALHDALDRIAATDYSGADLPQAVNDLHGALALVADDIDSLRQPARAHLNALDLPGVSAPGPVARFEGAVDYTPQDRCGEPGYLLTIQADGFPADLNVWLPSWSGAVVGQRVEVTVRLVDSDDGVGQ
jgi:hypothetical protein